MKRQHIEVECNWIFIGCTSRTFNMFCKPVSGTSPPSCYSSLEKSGNSTGTEPVTGYRKMQIDTDGMLITENGRIRCERPGNYIAVALTKNGTKHFFMLNAR